MNSAKQSLQFVAQQLGFDDCRVAAAGPALHAERFKQWVADKEYGDMQWFERNVDRRVDPRVVLPGCRSVVSLALNYYPGESSLTKNYKIARYAQNVDYHGIIEEKLKELDLAMQDLGGLQRYYVDTGPVLERDFASASGLGWNGKSTVQIHRKLGAWFFLAEVLTTLDLDPDKPARDHCGKCTACINACPTQAITGPRKMVATRCVSYFTIEHKGAIPVEFRRAIGDRLYGCDDCLAVCPWNRFAKVARETQFHAREAIMRHTLQDFLTLTEAEFNAVFQHSPIRRIKRERFLRNVCVVLGNVGTLADVPLLKNALKISPLVAEHALWAIDEIELREKA